MKLDFRMELDTRKVAEILNNYLDSTEIGKCWAEELIFLTQEKKRYLQPFLEEALANVSELARYYRPEDWWQCAVMSVDYFWNAFQVSIPVEVIRGSLGANSEIGYAFAFDDEFDMVLSEIVVGHSPKAFPQDKNYPLHAIVGALAHETWHAHQVGRIVDFLRREDGVVDLEAIDPTDHANRGAVYALSNMALYVNPAGGYAAYRNQIAEAEAIYIQRQVETRLIV